jgi:hypothetical protein
MARIAIVQSRGSEAGCTGVTARLSAIGLS